MAKYSKGAQKKVEEAMHEMHEGKLKSGGSGKKVTDPKQAIAIGLSEAREEGDQVPKKSGSGPDTKKPQTKKEKSGSKKPAAKKPSGPEPKKGSKKK